MADSKIQQLPVPTSSSLIYWHEIQKGKFIL